MNVIVNGESHELEDSGTIDTLLDELGANKAHTALMVNGDVVPSSEWGSTALRKNDEIEMLVFVGGG